MRNHDRGEDLWVAFVVLVFDGHQCLLDVLDHVVKILTFDNISKLRCGT